MQSVRAMRNMVSGKHTCMFAQKIKDRFANICDRMREDRKSDARAHRFDSSIACSTNSLDERLASEIESMVISAVAFAAAADADGAAADAGEEEEGADDEEEALRRRPRDVSARRDAASENEADCCNDEAKNVEARRDSAPCGMPVQVSRAAAAARWQSAAEAATRIAATDMAI